MTELRSFYEKPILNSPYEYPGEHWELDKDRHPTNKVIESRRPASFPSMRLLPLFSGT